MRGHQGVFAKLLVEQVRRIAEETVFAIGHANRTAEHPEDQRLGAGFSVDQRQDRPAGDFLRHGMPEDLEERRHEVGGLAQRRNPCPRLCGIVRMVDDQRNMRDLLVIWRQVLSPPVMLAQQETVIGRKHEAGIGPEIVLVEIVQKLAEIGVAHGHESGVVRPDLRDLVRAFLDRRVFRPVEDRAIVARRVLLTVFLGREERLVRIEAFELQKPVVRHAVVVEEGKGAREARRAGKILLYSYLFAIDLMLPPLRFRRHVVVLVGIHFLEALQRRLHHRDPRVVFLSANELPGLVAAVIRRAAVLVVVEVVADEMCVHAGLLQDIGHRIVERFERTPGAVHEVQPTRMHVAPGRHAGQRADIMIVEGHGPLGEAIEVRCRNRRSAIATKRETVE